MQVATHPMPIDSMSYPVGRYFIRQEPSHIGLMYLSRNKARMNAYPFFHILNKAKAHDVNSKWGVEAEDNIFDNIKPL